MDQDGQAVDLLPRLSEYYNTGMSGMQQGLGNAQSKPSAAWYRGVFSDDDLAILRFRTQERQMAALANLKASGKSLLVTPVKRCDSVLK